MPRLPLLFLLSRSLSPRLPHNLLPIFHLSIHRKFNLSSHLSSMVCLIGCKEDARSNADHAEDDKAWRSLKTLVLRGRKPWTKRRGASKKLLVLL